MLKNHFFIQVKPLNREPLKQIIAINLRLSPAVSETMIRQGSVWDKKQKKRLQNPETIIQNLLLEVYKPPRIPMEFLLQKEQIAYEDESLLIAYKPHHVPTQSTPYCATDNLSHGVNEYFKTARIKFTAEAVNRLDTETSGLVVFAKTKQAQANLHQQFQQRKVKKYYLAQTPLQINPKKFQNIKNQLTHQNKLQDAQTYIYFLESQNNFSNFLVIPKTGRFHQIRKHFQQFLLPIAGDKLYGSRLRGKLRLHCLGYKLLHPLKGNKLKVIVCDKKLWE